MSWGIRIIVVASALLTWFATAALYNEFGLKVDPEGMMRAFIGMLLVGPAVSSAQTWFFISNYRRLNSDLKRKQLTAGEILFSIGLIIIAHLLIT